MHYIPGLRLRVPDHVERLGIDESDMGEFAYDYVGPSPEIRSMVYGQSTAYDAARPTELKDRIITVTPAFGPRSDPLSH